MILYLLRDDDESESLYTIISHVAGGPFYYATDKKHSYPEINFYYDFWPSGDTQIRTICSVESCIEVEPLWGQLMWEHDDTDF